MKNTLRQRLEGFVDGVFAIAITLLAIELPTPNLTSGGEINFASFIPSIAAFMLSFASIAIFWVNHHRMTQHLIEDVPRRVVWLTMLFLFFQTIIPFSTKALLSNNFHSISLMMFSLVLLGASISFSILHYVTHSFAGSKISVWRMLLGPVSYIAACVSIYVSPILVFLFLVIPPFYYFMPKPTPRGTLKKATKTKRPKKK